MNLWEDLTAAQSPLPGLLLALLLGAVIGLQRGWQGRELPAGQRIAGFRTYTLVGLLGGFAVVLHEPLGPWPGVALLVAMAAAALIGFGLHAREAEDYSITGIVGLLLTFCFGALAVAGEPVTAAAAAVVTAFLLDNKTEIHGLLRRLQGRELEAALKLLLISVVLLPLLPNRGYGPGEVLNPYAIWWMVVLIATISFVGYFAIRIGGTERGTLFTSLFAGLASSTALTLHFARLSRDNRVLSPLLAAGILIACGTMFPRILVVCLALNPSLLPALTPPVLVMMMVLYAPALVIWWRHHGRRVEQPPVQQNPLELMTALTFGLILLVILVLGELLQRWLGDAGIYLLAATSGITDVDPITLSLTRMAQGDLATGVAVVGIIIAASVNSLVKAGMAASIGTRALGWRVATPIAAALVLGLGTAVATRLTP
ncbi:MgtC/SapB family protein [Arhodomonas sp. SL1]|uniref:MgtC/SapB family protein n=1 Tax=Arhodomonas sp. SL1 TaxID=3425691 RepID=UPI003F881B8E